MFAMLLIEIRPVYRFEDIGVLDLRVCYNGEWYFTRALSPYAVQQLLDEPSIGAALKQKMRVIIGNKGEIDFYDVYDMAYGKSRRMSHRSWRRQTERFPAGGLSIILSV